MNYELFNSQVGWALAQQLRANKLPVESWLGKAGNEVLVDWSCGI